MKSTSTEPIVFQQAYDLTQWYAQRTPGFPKTHRLTLGDRLEHALFDLLSCLQDAAYGKNRASALSQSQDHVDRLRLWNRVAKDLKCISKI
ncbi:MAG: four helix bundle protein [Planctomycetes bacterium]|nr:four helix bundle protein [Planctomycetota bacterium]